MSDFVDDFLDTMEIGMEVMAGLLFCALTLFVFWPFYLVGLVARRWRKL